MDDKKRVLIVTQEMKPYLLVSEIANITRRLPQHIQESGMDIRVLMPRFGNINERRNRLHEVVRLSGINITVNDEDYPLIIKVASLPGARMQVYFLDNEDLFKRKGVFHDESQNFYDDNDARMAFFCKGVLETVKKFGWPPHLIHCHGWMTSLIPFYMKTQYKNDPMFDNTKVVYSVYDNQVEGSLSDDFLSTAAGTNEIPEDKAAFFKKGDIVGLDLGGSSYADAVIKGSESLHEEVESLLGENGKPILEYKGDEEYLEAYREFYNTLLDE